MQGLLDADERHLGLEADVPRAFGQDDAHLHLGVADAFAHARALEERHLEHVAAAAFGRLEAAPQEVAQVGVPADAEAVFPPAEDGVPWLELEVGLLAAAAAAEARRAHVADVVGEVRVQGAGAQGHVEGAQRRGWRAVVLRRGPLHAVEVAAELRALVCEPVPLLARQVPAPLRDFNVPLQERGVDERSGELVPHAGGLEGTGGDGVVVGAVGEGAAEAVRGASGNVGDVGRGEFDLGFLLEGGVGGGSVDAEGVEEVLFVLLVDFQRERC